MSAVWVKPSATTWLRDRADQAQAGMAAIEGIADTFETIAEVLDKTGQVISVVEQVLSADPVSAVLQAAAGQVFDFIHNLRSTDLYIFPICPVGWKSLLRPYTVTHAIADVQQSLVDHRDGSRPKASENAAYAQVTILVGADRWMDFQRLLDLLDKVFSGDYWGNWGTLDAMRRNFRSYTPTPRVNRGTEGQPWDWWRSNMLEALPILSPILDKIEAILGSLGSFAEGLGATIQSLARMLQKKLAILRALIEQIAILAELIRNWNELVPNMHILYTSGTSGGTEQFSRDLTTAARPPTYQLTCGITLLALGTNPKNNFDNFLQFLGLQKESLQAAGDQIQGIISPEEGP